MQEIEDNQVSIKNHTKDQKNNMDKRFDIKINFYKINEIEVSKRITSYIESKILENIFIKNNLLIKTKWSFLFSFFLSDSRNFLEEFKNDIAIHMIRTDSANNLKVSGALVPDCLINSNKPKNEEFIRLLLLSLKIFLQQTYPKINDEKFDYFYKSIDFKYLNSLPYPADVDDRDYFIVDGNKI